MDYNFLFSIIEHNFHYPALSVTRCVRIVVNFSQKVDFPLGMNEWKYYDIPSPFPTPGVHRHRVRGSYELPSTSKVKSITQEIGRGGEWNNKPRHIASVAG